MKKCFFAARMTTLLLVCVFVLSVSEASAQPGKVTAVSALDLNRYSGKWFEISKLPIKFQRQCVGNTTTTFSTMKADGEMEVLNRCLQKSGKFDELRGQAKVITAGANSKMKMSFDSFSSDSYWVVDLDPNYQYAVVGNPDRKYLWILSRTPKMDDGVYQNILRRVETMGYNPNKLVKTPQNVETLKGAVVEKQ
jgi:apolipoprotein D and lipocalin family protein